jgi:glycosyltransferase involved in cell wall biosynthesis
MLKTTILIPAYQPNENMVTIVKQLSEMGYTHILIVNDGSDESTHGYFLRAEMYGATLLHHSRNLGKGAALRTGIRYAKEHFPNDIGIVTADADGQHLPKDIKRVAEALKKNPTSLVLGTRDFEGSNVPKKSKYGNKITSAFFYLTKKKKCPDTQTGLRGIPNCLLSLALEEQGKRYEYEMNFLSDAADMVDMVYVPIETVYEELATPDVGETVILLGISANLQSQLV